MLDPQYETIRIMQNEIKEKDEKIKELEEVVERLRNKLLDMVEGTETIKKETPKYIKENYIPKQKVKDKIEELSLESNEVYERFLIKA